MGVYTVTLTASISQPTLLNPTAILSTSQTFLLTVGNDCFGTTFIDKFFYDMIIDLGQVMTQDITFRDELAVDYGIPTYCGPRVLAFTGGLPTYLSLDAT
jgi:hypothetical protein